MLYHEPFQVKIGKSYFEIFIDSNINFTPYSVEYNKLKYKNENAGIKIFIQNLNAPETTLQFKTNKIEFDTLHKISFLNDWKSNTFFSFKTDPFTSEDILMTQNWIRYIGIYYSAIKNNMLPLHSAFLRIKKRNIIIAGNVCTGKTSLSIQNLLNDNLVFTDEDTLLLMDINKLKAIPIPRLLQVPEKPFYQKISNKFSDYLLYEDKITIFNQRINLLHLPEISKRTLIPKKVDKLIFLNYNKETEKVAVRKITSLEKVYKLLYHMTNFDYLTESKTYYKKIFKLLTTNLQNIPDSYEITYAAKDRKELYNLLVSII
ncbi:hypothetical protein KAU33_12190 [Candidatus Dependentiae bacterium]|nr:hypothetical protein [Candidatus Dependentiae bacterium]